MKSNELKQIEKEKVGYRNDDLSTGRYEIQDVIEFETVELGNDDIYETCQNFYGTRDVEKVIKDKFGNETVWGIWLTTVKGVLNNYKEVETTTITTYKLPSDALPISDIGEDGILFATTEYPGYLVTGDFER